MKVAEERRFNDYRIDHTLDQRSMRVALRRLRQLTRTGLASELDLDGTVDGSDFGVFGSAFGTNVAGNDLFASLDWNNDGTIDATDFGAFGANFGVTL